MDYGVEPTGRSKLRAEPFENEIVHGDEILDLALRAWDVIRHDDRTIGSGLPIVGLQRECFLFPDHRSWPDHDEKRAVYSTRRQQQPRPVVDLLNTGHPAN